MPESKGNPGSAAAERLMRALRRMSAASVLHSHAVARRVGLSPTDLECLDLILEGGPATAGEIGRQTGLSSGAVTGLIDRLERRGLVERMADARDRRKVRVRAVEAGIAPIAALYEPMRERMEALLASYDDVELALIAEFGERGAELALARAAELDRGGEGG